MLMWLIVNPAVVNELCMAAVRLYDGLATITDADESIVGCAQLSLQTQARVRAALPVREPYWYLATDTGADFRPNTLPAAQGGDLGRLIAQINDVALHIDVLLRIAPVLYGRLPYDWLVRSALLVELAALLDLTVGSPPSPTPTLLELCHYGRPKAAAAELTRLRHSIPFETRQYIRWCRDKFGAHMDKDLRLVHLHHHLAALDYQGMTLIAEHLLNWLDVLGANQLDLKLLVMGERRIGSWPLDADSSDGLAAPDPRTIPGSLARLFQSIDSPYMSGAATTMGSAVLAGISAGREPSPRQKVKLPLRRDRYLDWALPRLHIRSSRHT